ncbi:hypothetical protein F5Y02DRAFT_320779 [Annulohypoxylon stygium]|nr:hypothetical protein F5Y02DRAFT_320779 [Annulohypoxylon stygium]
MHLHFALALSSPQCLSLINFTFTLPAFYLLCFALPCLHLPPLHPLLVATSSTYNFVVPFFFFVTLGYWNCPTNFLTTIITSPHNHITALQPPQPTITTTATTTTTTITTIITSNCMIYVVDARHNFCDLCLTYPRIPLFPLCLEH